MGFDFIKMSGSLFRQAVRPLTSTVPQASDNFDDRNGSAPSCTKLNEYITLEQPDRPEEMAEETLRQGAWNEGQDQDQANPPRQRAPSTPDRRCYLVHEEERLRGDCEGDSVPLKRQSDECRSETGYVMVQRPCSSSELDKHMSQEAKDALQEAPDKVAGDAEAELSGPPWTAKLSPDCGFKSQACDGAPEEEEKTSLSAPALPAVIPPVPEQVPAPSTPSETSALREESEHPPFRNRGISNKPRRGSPLKLSPPTSLGEAPVMRKLIPLETGWAPKVRFVMATSARDSETPLSVIKSVSNALSIQTTPDGQSIEVVARSWQELKEAEALLRLVFQYYKGEGKWWLYTIPTFVSCIIAGIEGTELPQFSNPALGLHCAIAPYDAASTRRAFFLTCPEWGPQNAAYHFIRRCWEYWKDLGLERQLDRYLSVLLGVVVVPIRADGNCLFRALAKSVLGAEGQHLQVRREVVQFMRSSEELRGFIVAEDEGEDDAAFAERYFAEMEQDGTWGDQVEITAFTRVYRRAVRVWSYNYTEARLLSVVTPLNEATAGSHGGAGDDAGGEGRLAGAGARGTRGPGEEIWLLHLHGHYSLLEEGKPPRNEEWEQMLREWGEEKDERTNVLSSPRWEPQEATEDTEADEERAERAENIERQGRREFERDCEKDATKEGSRGVQPIRMDEESDLGSASRRGTEGP